ncbi:PfkB family carbohydrate kinase [Pectobacteriaceae bacterium CE90]|nr:PfkB family carbohydrate kinase [Prodigiosinella sp. LS101]WJV54321.1 PfkB family carbohydrate kinase [Prodigiosinella sp. LS101]WJV58683.1 PfkB family carbohydrate kinase [Pectobacteriaceae bacterium C111]WJY14662.1 PfkB family carbohydrate kinase [Pectobacteriaceae bacterium CE90]
MSIFHAKVPVVAIGGAVCDMVLSVERLPFSGEDIEAEDGGRQVGGCAFNVARALCQLQVPVINGMPVGNGHWGQMVEQAMTKLGLPVLLRNQERDNGWCLALAERDGNDRTFVSITGCESIWTPELLQRLSPPENALIYASGYELAGETGAALREWLLNQPQRKLLDPGPRIADIPATFFQALPGTNTMLTLNRDETRYLCGGGDTVAQASHYAKQNGLWLICRLDKAGAWICPPDAAAQEVPAYKVDVVDTIGAGDAHCGGLLAGLAADWSLHDAVDLANRVAACVVASQGAAGAPDWKELQQRFPDVHTNPGR